MNIAKYTGLLLLTLLISIAFNINQSKAGAVNPLCAWGLGLTTDMNGTDADSSPPTFEEDQFVMCIDALAGNPPPNTTTTSGSSFGDNQVSDGTQINGSFPLESHCSATCRVSMGNQPPDETIIGCICTDETSDGMVGDTTNTFNFEVVPNMGVECTLDSFSFDHGFNVDGNRGRLLLFQDGTLIGTVDQMAGNGQVFTNTDFPLPGPPVISSSSIFEIRGFDINNQDARLVIDNMSLDGNCVFIEEFICDDQINNDNDGFLDCEEETCNGEIGGPEGQLCEFQQELSCNDGFDNDADGDMDCEDFDDCRLDEACIEPAPTMSEWGLILFAIIAGGFAVWFVRRKNLATS